MHTFANRLKPRQQVTFAKSPMPRRVNPGQRRWDRPIFQLQRTIGNQAVQRILRVRAGPVQERNSASSGAHAERKIDKTKVQDTLQRTQSDEANDTSEHSTPEIDVAAAQEYNARRGYSGAALALIAQTVGAPGAGLASQELAYAIAVWQGASIRLQPLTADGKLGPSSLGIVSAELRMSGRAQEAAHSDENGHRFRREAATHSNPKRPLFLRSELTGVIVAVG